MDSKMLRFMLLLTFVLLWCTGCGSDTNSSNQSGQEKTSKTIALEGELLDAMDLLIFASSGSSFNPVKPSENLESRLKKYFGNVKYNLEAKGVRNLLVENGAMTTVPAGSVFVGKLAGALNAEISIIEGEIGIEKGEIVVGEGTRATVNGDEYKYQSGKWTLIEEVVQVQK